MKKNFQIQTSMKQLFTKYQFITKLPQILLFHKNHNFYNWKFIDHPLLPYKFHVSDMWGIYFFIFASCEPLTLKLKTKQIGLDMYVQCTCSVNNLPFILNFSAMR